MHPEIDSFIVKVKTQHPDYFIGKKVLEVGSQDINGSIRHHFLTSDYTGIDLGEAIGVDIVADIVDFKHPNEYDVVISTEMLEHCKEWRKALRQMYKNLKPGGLFLLTCAGPNRQEHGTHHHSPQDSKFTLEHYGNISILDFMSVLPVQLKFSDYHLGLEREDCDLVMWGIKK